MGKVNWALRFYRDVLKLRHLHYGLWDAGAALTLENLHHAQEEYGRHLTALFPRDVQRVLDVGWGTRAIPCYFGAGYSVEGCRHRSAIPFMKGHRGLRYPGCERGPRIGLGHPRHGLSGRRRAVAQLIPAPVRVCSNSGLISAPRAPKPLALPEGSQP